MTQGTQKAVCHVVCHHPQTALTVKEASTTNPAPQDWAVLGKSGPLPGKDEIRAKPEIACGANWGAVEHWKLSQSWSASTATWNCGSLGWKETKKKKNKNQPAGILVSSSPDPLDWSHVNKPKQGSSCPRYPAPRSIDLQAVYPFQTTQNKHFHNCSHPRTHPLSKQTCTEPI